MYNEDMMKYSDRPIEIIPDILGSEMAAGSKREDADQEAYHRFEHYSSPYPDIWRESPQKSSAINEVMPRGHDVAPRSPIIGDYSYNGGIPLSSVEMEPFNGLFTFSTGYKDLPTFKEKATNDNHVADALLSLKHGVVHNTQMAPPMSPLSPTLPSIAQHPGSSALGQMAPFACGGAQQPAAHASGFGSEPGCASAQFADQPTSGQYPAPPHGVFPSMSVNVSMSMNVGIPGNIQNYNLGEHGPWAGSPYGHHQNMAAPSPTPYYGPSHGMPPQTSQYPAYAAPVPPQSFHASYTFSDLRNANLAPNDAIYRKQADPYKATAKFYSLNPLSMRRSKMAAPRGSHVENTKVNLCRICGKTYARPSTLKTHMRTHSGEKPYRCSTCNKSFSQAANLTAHVRTHSGEKPFRCPICERRFSQSSSVTTHMRTHSGERPYRCRMCKKAFSDSSTLTKHLRIHSGEKPYQCKLCLLRFSQSGNLNRHMRVHANNS